MYLFVSSNDCKELYPNNSPTDFTVELPQAITGTHLSLRHVYFRKRQSGAKSYYYLLCDLVEPSVLAGKETTVLGSFFERGNLEYPQTQGLACASFKRIRLRVINSNHEIPEDLGPIFFTIEVSHV